MSLQMIQNSNKLKVILMHLSYSFIAIHLIWIQEHKDNNVNKYGTSFTTVYFG
jgi:hypothetical protein